jgi:uncharacterized protein
MSTPPSSLAIVVMAKYPTPGLVKTRLQPRVSADDSAFVQRVFLQHVVERLASLNAGDVVVCFDPPDAGEAMAELVGEGVRLVAQSPGNLTDRLDGARRALADDYGRILFFGVDSPDVPRSALAHAIDAMNAHDVLIAPTADGGYWCLGVPCGLELSDVLSDIDWSSGVEYEQTLARLRAAGLDVGVGRAWSDVDHVEDLVALVERLIPSHDPDDRLLFAQLKDLWPVLTRVE